MSLPTRLSVAFLTLILFLSISCSRTTEREALLDPSEVESLTHQYDTLVKAASKYRNNADFDSAIKGHLEALQIATQLRDTLGIIKMLNQTATDYRRKGELEEATDYHYRALDLCAKYSDKTSYDARKARVNSLNGIGNIALTVGNDRDAEEMFREALKGETSLESELGMAINCANLGSIMETRGELDSAFVWYTRAIDHNRAAGSDLGVGLCHNYFGSIYYKKGQMAQAIIEFLNSYELLKEVGDDWHTIEPCFSLANMYMSENRLSDAYPYILQGLSMAQSMESLEHQAEGYNMMAQYYEKTGKDKDAVKMYKKYIDCCDKLSITHRSEHLLSSRFQYQSERHNDEIATLSKEMKLQKKIRNTVVIAVFVLFILALGVIGNLLYALKTRKRNQEAMESMEKTRLDFFTNITHEFRTPLTIILGLGKELEKNLGDDPGAKQDVESIITHGNNMLDLVNQLLDISRVKSSVGDAEWRKGDVSQLLGQIVEVCSVYASQNFITVEYDHPDGEVIMDFIPEYIKKSLSNLIFNSVKYTQRGGKVKVSVSKTGGKVKIVVSDNGHGIPEDRFPHVFEPFYIGGDTGHTMSSGVGLVMVKQMIEAMNGTIEIESKVDVGTNLTIMIPEKNSSVDLPLWNPASSKKTENADNEVKEVSEDETDDTPLILVSEDNEDIASFIGRLLTPKYKVIYARNGQEAYDKSQEYMPDMIITDVMMPIMSGYDLCRKVRSSLAINHIPIIVVSAKTGEEDRIEALRSGADSFITKPFQPDELRTLVSNAFSRRDQIRDGYNGAMKEAKRMEQEIPVAHKEFLSKLNTIIFERIDDLTLNSETIADIVCLSQRQLNRKVKTITGIDTLKYIRGCRLSYARKLLTTTDIPIGEIVTKCGFDSASYFAKMYKQIYGVTPSATRKNPSSTE